LGITIVVLAFVLVATTEFLLVEDADDQEHRSK
jgi:hypothetical protein